MTPQQHVYDQFRAAAAALGCTAVAHLPASPPWGGAEAWRPSVNTANDAVDDEQLHVRPPISAGGQWELAYYCRDGKCWIALIVQYVPEWWRLRDATAAATAAVDAAVAAVDAAYADREAAEAAEALRNPEDPWVRHARAIAREDDAAAHDGRTACHARADQELLEALRLRP